MHISSSFSFLISLLFRSSPSHQPPPSTYRGFLSTMNSMDVDDIINNLRPDDDLTLDYDFQQEKSLDYNKLKNAWASERMAPNILPFDHGLLDRTMDRVRQQLLFIEENTLQIDQEKDMKMKLLIVESELERIKFLVRGYLRLRLSKIDRYATYILKNTDQLDKLSESEKSYLQRHSELLTNLYGSQFLSALPENLQTLDDESGGISMIETPDMDRAVFIRVVEPDTPGLRAGPDDFVDMEKGSIHVFRYSAVEKHIQNGFVQLI